MMSESMPLRASLGDRVFKRTGQVYVHHPLYSIELTDPMERIRAKHYMAKQSHQASIPESIFDAPPGGLSLSALSSQPRYPLQQYNESRSTMAERALTILPSSHGLTLNADTIEIDKKEDQEGRDVGRVPKDMTKSIRLRILDKVPIMEYKDMPDSIEELRRGQQHLARIPTHTTPAPSRSTVQGLIADTPTVNVDNPISEYALEFTKSSRLDLYKGNAASSGQLPFPSKTITFPSPQ